MVCQAKLQVSAMRIVVATLLAVAVDGDMVYGQGPSRLCGATAPESGWQLEARSGSLRMHIPLQGTLSCMFELAFSHATPQFFGT